MRLIPSTSNHHSLLTPHFAIDPSAHWNAALYINTASRCGAQPPAIKPRFCDWPKQARCKAREVQVYAHTPNLPQQSRLPVFDNPEGFENWLLQMSLSHFGAKDGQLHCISICLCAAQYKYLPILKRKIWVKMSVMIRPKILPS